MPQLLGSFLLRVWQAGYARRIAIEHIQSGDNELVTSIEEAANWINAHLAESHLPIDTDWDTAAPVANDEVDDQEGDSMPGTTN